MNSYATGGTLTRLHHVPYSVFPCLSSFSVTPFLSLSPSFSLLPAFHLPCFLVSRTFFRRFSVSFFSVLHVFLPLYFFSRCLFIYISLHFSLVLVFLFPSLLLPLLLYLHIPVLLLSSLALSIYLSPYTLAKLPS